MTKRGRRIWEPTGRSIRRPEGCELPPPSRRPSIPSLAEVAQLLLVCPARHPGHRPVPNPPAPLGTLFLLPFSQAAHHQLEPGRGSASSEVHARGWVGQLSRASVSPLLKEWAKGQGWNIEPELWGGTARSLSTRIPQPLALPQPGGQ